nr:MAG TPA: hypothetical protein [Caudoviricetes sp.]
MSAVGRDYEPNRLYYSYCIPPGFPKLTISPQVACSDRRFPTRLTNFHRRFS